MRSGWYVTHPSYFSPSRYSLVITLQIIICNMKSHKRKTWNNLNIRHLSRDANGAECLPESERTTSLSSRVSLFSISSSSSSSPSLPSGPQPSAAHSSCSLASVSSAVDEPHRLWDASQSLNTRFCGRPHTASDSQTSEVSAQRSQFYSIGGFCNFQPLRLFVLTCSLACPDFWAQREALL